MLEQFLPTIYYFVNKTCTNQWNLAEAAFEAYDLTFVLKGNAVYYVDSKQYNLNEGDAIFIKKGQSRKAETDSFMVCAAFTFDMQSQFNIDLSTSLNYLNDPDILMYIKEFNLEWLRKGPEYMMRCNGLLMLTIHRLLYLSMQSKPHYTVEIIKKFIVEHYTEPITVSDVAKFVGLNAVYCGTLFKKHANMSIIDYLHTIRTNHARELLKIGQLNVSEIALQTGFQDAYYFSKVYKKYKGVSPKSVR